MASRRRSCSLRARFTEQRVGERCAQLVERPRCGAGIAVCSPAAASTTRRRDSRPRTDRHRRSSAPRCHHLRAITAARYRPTGQPSVRSVTSVAISGLRSRSAFAEDLGGAGRVEGQVVRRELERVARCSQPGQMGLFRATRRDQLRAWWYSVDEDAQRVVARRRLQLVQVVEHEHEGLRARPERGRQARRRASQHRHAEAAHPGDEIGVAGRPSVRRRHQGEQGRGVIVRAGEGDPPDRAILRACPLGEERRLAVARGRSHADDAGTAGPGRAR